MENKIDVIAELTPECNRKLFSALCDAMSELREKYTLEQLVMNTEQGSNFQMIHDLLNHSWNRVLKEENANMLA